MTFSFGLSSGPGTSAGTRLAGKIALRLLFAAIFALGAAGARADEIADIGKLLKGGQYDQAMSRVDAYLSSKPKDAQGRFLKGLILTEQNKTADAIAMFSGLTTDYPELPEPYNNLAVLYAGQGQYEKARQALEMAIRTHPSYATAHENLGDVYAKLASQAYDKALSLDSSNSTAQTKLALLKELIGTGNRARTQIAAATPAPAKGTPPAATPTPAPPAKDAAKAATPAATPTPPTQTPPPAAAAGKGDDAEVAAAVNAWANAWASKDVDGYLGAYTKDFKQKGESHGAWAASRKQRIEGASSISVKVSSLKVSFTDANTAVAKFRQDYKSNITAANSSKTLVLSKAGGKWQIVEERSGG
ncbi:MAG TPA: tetratricopeptide repeat protein [Burkholderiales bacterium]|jgi:tetratricopeptide (TPR) repeat protein|nr:tetratricopeptide repeat protein [Burkholderiales bacterium]